MHSHLVRIQIDLSGWGGGPGVSTMYAGHEGVTSGGEIEALAGAIRAAYESLKTYLLDGMQVRINPTVDVITTTDGQLAGRFVITPPPLVTGLGSGGNSPRSTMGKLQFLTATPHNGRMIRGGCFFGPLASSSVDNAGNLQAAFVAAVPPAFTAVLANDTLPLVVWSRPKEATVDPPEDARAGFDGDVVAIALNAVPAVLRSRRD
jgi:hypothetical protein